MFLFFQFKKIGSLQCHISRYHTQNKRTEKQAEEVCSVYLHFFPGEIHKLRLEYNKRLENNFISVERFPLFETLNLY